MKGESWGYRVVKMSDFDCSFINCPSFLKLYLLLGVYRISGRPDNPAPDP